MFISHTNSTNDYLKQHPDCDRVWTTWQSAGRGQAGNSWESEPGKNVLMSVRLKQPAVPLQQAFRLQMAVSLAVRDVVARLLPDKQVTVKWPNDIYVGKGKICGILIESSVAAGQISEAIIGIGLNINQTTWQSPAPNPVSVKQLSGNEYALPPIYEALCDSISEKLLLLGQPARLKEQYLAVLYRFGEKALYARREVSLTPSRILVGETPDAFEATITDVTDQGELVLESDNERMPFHFKQIQFVI